MNRTSPEVDAYIERSAEFAQPILKKLRKVFHKACPKLQETMKWNFPHFEYKGIVGSMAAFKEHVSFGFWKGKMMSDPLGLFATVGKTEMSARRVTQLSDLPAEKDLMAYIKEAVQLNEQKVKLPRPEKKKKGPLEVPDDLAAALAKNKKAKTTFQGFSPSHQREYVEWITEARQAATRERRMATTIEWLSEGKPRNWKYVNC